MQDVLSDARQSQETKQEEAGTQSGLEAGGGATSLLSGWEMGPRWV